MNRAWGSSYIDLRSASATGQRTVVHSAIRYLFCLTHDYMITSDQCSETETEIGQWVMGKMGHHFWMGHAGHGSLPVTH